MLWVFWVLLVFWSSLGSQGTFRCWVLLVTVFLGVHCRAGTFPLPGQIYEHLHEVRLVVGAQCSGIHALALFGK